MRRETTNRIRFFIEDVLPPILRDSKLFLWLAELAWGKHISDLAEFRARAPFLTEEAYADLYRKHPRVHAGTDNSEACIRRVVEEVQGDSVCDIGCGTGALLTRIRQGHPTLTRVTGVDFVIDDAAALPGVEYIAAKIENLPFADGEFDTVVCTHVIEHVLEYHRAIAELRRIARRRVIIVVPREREARYSFNPHFNFFPYTHSFLRAMHPVPAQHSCVDIGRDIFYMENVER
ncbi:MULTISPECIES: class I SAM-dependent methyltransferase [Rhizobium]|uniref:Class I SAM-dependent methyltransferase n=1 Tax=Rhizobium wuzhouense TaxID=1986026 RepID=A0ABX5NXC5_9HYPH|nr:MULTISPECIES: class I SAM-dependent methyltransferase [Rhizobium]PYB77845.1 class I SAM-dependent methyltransferase [Rhizobium wuzhouense]RKE86536.1 methyltransferase family protein [Rhizobium sp. AG855]